MADIDCGPSGAGNTPSTYDYLKPNSFKFFINGCPDVNFTCQSVSMLGINLGPAPQTTPFVDIPLPGDKIIFNDLSITYMVQEGLQNYLELWTWVQALGFPRNHGQFSNLPNIKKNVAALGSHTLEYSDAKLIVYSAANNPLLTFNFFDCFPTSLSNLDFDSRTTTVDYITATAIFKYRSFELAT